MPPAYDGEQQFIEMRVPLKMAPYSVSGESVLRAILQIGEDEHRLGRLKITLAPIQDVESEPIRN